MPTHREEEPENDGRSDREDPGGASGRREDEWDRGSWDRDDRDEWESRRKRPPRSLLHSETVRYTPPDSGPQEQRDQHAGDDRRLDRGQTIAFMLLAGIGLGAGIGYGIDRLAGTFPAFMLVGVFVGFGIALYAVYLETR